MSLASFEGKSNESSLLLGSGKASATLMYHIAQHRISRYQKQLLIKVPVEKSRKTTRLIQWVITHSSVANLLSSQSADKYPLKTSPSFHDDDDIPLRMPRAGGTPY